MNLIKTLERIRFSSNQNIGEGESNFEDKYVEKSVQPIQNTYLNNLKKIVKSRHDKTFSCRLVRYFGMKICYDIR